MMSSRVKKMITACEAILAKETAQHLRRAAQNAILFLYDERWQLELYQVARRLKDQPQNIFNHCDVRSDNLAWNDQTGRVILVDWNWAGLVPRQFGSTEFLVDMAVRGLDISAYKNLRNRGLLAGMVGFYLKRCIRPVDDTGEELSTFRLRTAVIALDLSGG